MPNDLASRLPSPGRLLRDPLLLVLLLVGLGYVGNAWSPSSYGLVLRDLGAANDGVVLFEPQAIRSDEWSVWTPFTQMSVANGFGRWNGQSIYGEDLRNFNALPLLDWALAFRPQYWLYFLTDPAYAFSFSHYFFTALFLLGYRAMFRTLGMPGDLATVGSVVLYFSAFTQAWWTTWQPILAYYPWLVVALLSSGPAWRRFMTVYWTTGALLLGHLYPPIIVPLVYAGVFLVLALRPDAVTLNRVLVGVLAGTAAAATAGIYFMDVIPAMANSVYPGQREVTGGRISLRHFLQQIFPHINILRHEPLADGLKLRAPNGCEITVVGSYLPLAAVLLHGWRGGMARGTRTALLVLAAGLVPIAVWMMLPVPSWAGRLLYWSAYSPQRHFFSAGLLITAMALVVLRDRPLRITPLRLLLLGGLGVAAWVYSKAPHGALAAGWKDLLIVAAAAGLGGALLAGWSGPWLRRAMLAAVGLVSVVAFGDYNPVMSAHAIFRPPQTAETTAWAERAGQHPNGWLIVEHRVAGLGAVPGGLGFKAVNHVLTIPRPDLFRPRFPDLPDEELNWLFNRYTHVRPRFGVEKPYLDATDAVGVPVEAFLPARPVTVAVACPSGEAGGFIDRRTVEADGRVRLSGWSRFRGPFQDQAFVVAADRPLAGATAFHAVRPDVASYFKDSRLTFAGFTLDLRPADPSDPPRTICIVTRDRVDGISVLAVPGP